MAVTNLEDKEKHDTLQKYLLDEYVLVHVDPAHAGVKVPEILARNPTVTLKLSKLFRGRLVVEKRLITAELLFGQEYFECQIPLASVWGMTTVKGKSVLWPTSAPQEILQTLAAASSPSKEGAADNSGKLPPPATEGNTAPPAEGEDKATRKEKKRGHLRLVK